MALYDVTGIGNAIVDVLCPCEDRVLDEHNITKGTMTLIDEDKAIELYNAISDKSTQKSGGSAANTMAGIASFGGKGAYIGLVANDDLGHVFTSDMQDTGITYNTAPHIQGLETARSFIFITPDGQRSMNTFLGACTELSVEHINSFHINNASVTYMEGYLFDKDPAKEAFFMSSKLAHEAGNKVALTLSDKRCAERHNADLRHLINDNVDILFGNEPELCALFQTDNIDDAFKMACDQCDIVVSSRGAKGVFINQGTDTIFVDSVPGITPVDLTGAGDQLAAGFLYGYTQGFDMRKCGNLATKAAAEAVSHLGPRPQISYSDFLND